MPTRIPALFVSHGAPSILLDESPTRSFLQQLGRTVGRPKGIVCISAHWGTAAPQVTLHPQPATLYDFGGFPEELYQRTYPAPGDPTLAQQVLTLLRADGVPAEPNPSRGLDHGVWVPLMLSYPAADVPVVQLSVQPDAGPEQHLAIGRALRSLPDEGILILASGAATHNLRDFSRYPLLSPPVPYAREFADWLKDAVLQGRTDELLQYRQRAPHARLNHPTPEHFLPLFVALGAGGAGRILHDAYTYGVLSMAAFAWQ